MKQRLKSLELHGYKTFASKTRFEFPDNITAIVGPNGSGKSNIADAIRWVLGEQAYSLLRGKKTIDMIFAGSELKPRASMASASIVFDNEDGWLPIDYAEVSLTRRAYRNGENEYLLNNTRVRLKEINELLANSGLSERTYTIIGQGLVDSALSLKPEERRRFFEEAAGIELYRSRRDEAIQKLDATRRNMERVQDILNEIRPRLKSLEKQADRARDYERIKADLLLLLRDWYGFQWNNLQKELAASQEVKRAQEKKLNRDRVGLTEIDKSIEKIRIEINNLRNELAGWHQNSSEQHLKKESINRELAILEERKKAYQGKKLDLEHSHNLLQEEIASLTKQLEDVVKEKIKKSENLRNASNYFLSAEVNIQKRQRQRQIIEESIKDERSPLEKIETRQVQIKTQIEEIDHRISLFGADLEHVRDSYQKDAVVTSNVIEKQKIQKQMLDVKNDEVNHITSFISDLESSLKAFEEETRITLEEQTHQKSSLATLQAQREILDQAEKSLSGFTSGSKNLLQAAQSGKIKGKIDLLLSYLQIDPEYEIAFASVLGEALEALVLEKNTQPERVLKFLENAENGRTMLLPLAWISQEKQIDKEFEQFGNRAKQIVQSPENIKPIIDVLLKNVYFVKDRNAAQEFLSKNKGEFRVVTLKGEVFYSNGLVIAGKELRVKNISRKREILGLDRTIGNETQLLLKLDEKLVKLHENMVEKQKILSEKIEDRKKILYDQSQLISTLNNISIDLDQIKNKTKWQEENILSLETQIKTSNENKKLLIQESKEISAQIQTTREKIENIFQELKSLPLDELQQELFVSRTNKAVEEQIVNNLELQIKSLNAQCTETKSAIEEIQKKIESNDTALIQNQGEKDRLIDKEKELEESLNKLEENILPAEKRIHDLDIQATQLLQKQEHSRQQFLITERHSIQAQMRVSRIREQQDNLKRRVEEDFGLVSYDYALSVDGPNPLPLDGIVENLPRLAEISDSLEENIKQQKSLLRRIGPINPEAQKEFNEVHERSNFLADQTHDLEKAETDLRQVVTELDELMKTEFTKTFKAVNEIFKDIFEKLFGGGSANLVIADEENLAESGIDIQATLPGKRKQELASLSGGERSLTAVALIFALLKVSPTPFCILDEVDAMLDESNVMRFGDLLKELSASTQFIVITHNRNTVQLANVLYGVTMGKDSTSQVISLKLDELTEELVQ